jgi:hypothetical protein
MKVTRCWKTNKSERAALLRVLLPLFQPGDARLIERCQALGMAAAMAPRVPMATRPDSIWNRTAISTPILRKDARLANRASVCHPALSRSRNWRRKQEPPSKTRFYQKHAH